jgi:hypothetical protein
MLFPKSSFFRSLLDWVIVKAPNFDSESSRFNFFFLNCRSL